MSEKQHKRMRKQAAENPQKPEHSKKNTWFNVICILIVAAFLGFAAYAVVNQYVGSDDVDVEDTDVIEYDDENTDTDYEAADGEAEEEAEAEVGEGADEADEAEEE